MSKAVGDSAQSRKSKPLSAYDLTEALDQFASKMVDHISRISNIGEVRTQHSTSTPKDSTENNLWSNEIQTHFQNPTCPNGRVYDAWNLWWVGVPGKSVALRLLRSKDFSQKQHRCNYSKMKFVIGWLVRFSNVPEVDIPRVNVSERLSLYSRCFSLLIQKLVVSSDRRRLDGISYHRLYDMICKSKIVVE